MRRALIAAAATIVATAPAYGQGRASGAPVVDHHQHLLSPATAAFWTGPGLPAVAVPAEVSRLLARRDSAYGDSAALAPMYADSAVLFAQRGDAPELHRGRGAAAGYVATVFARPYRVTPIDFRMEENVAHLAAYVTRGEANDPRHFGHLVLALTRGDDGAWRIAGETLAFPGPQVYRTVPADTLIALLDQAGIQKALVLSVGYTHSSAWRERTDDEYAKVRAENDWTAQQVARFPDRLRAFCGINPLRPWAMEEIERCDRDPNLSGIKLHFGNSGVDLRDPAHLEQVRRVFQAANERRMPIMAHLRTWRIPYGREASDIFIREVLPAAPDIPIQIAHMAASGPGWNDPESDSALAVLAEARAARDPRVRNLWFDMATVVDLRISPEHAQTLATRIRQIGVDRVVYGSDMAVGGNLAPRQGWAVIRGLLPLTDEEFRTIASNVAPYMR